MEPRRFCCARHRIVVIFRQLSWDSTHWKRNRMRYILKEDSKPLGNEAVQRLLDALIHVKKTLDGILCILETQRSKCSHHWVVTEFNTTWTVGQFMLTCVCRECGSSKEEMGPPICTCCGKPLELKVWEGKARNNATPDHLSLWEEEFSRRNVSFKDAPLSHDMFFCNIGLYVCSNEGCDECGKSKFYITDGD